MIPLVSRLWCFFAEPEVMHSQPFLDDYVRMCVKLLFVCIRGPVFPTW